MTFRAPNMRMLEAETYKIQSKPNLSNLKPGHTTGGSGRGTWRGGRAGSGRIGRRLNISAALCSWLLTSGSASSCFCEPFARRACQGIEKHNNRLTNDRRQVDNRDRTCFSFLVVNTWICGCFFLYAYFHAMHVRDQ